MQSLSGNCIKQKMDAECLPCEKLRPRILNGRAPKDNHCLQVA